MADWKELHGEHELRAIRTDVRHPFDADANGCVLQLGDLTIFIFEDPRDGYRSLAAEPLVSKSPLYSFGCDPEYFRAPVLCRALTPGQYADGADGIELIDRRNGKTILRLGTDKTDDHYPHFECVWTPENLAENPAA